MTRALDLPSRLVYLTAPVLPLLKKVKVTRRGSRDHRPQDILLPAGYVAEVVATGLNAPVHCCFDDAGFCYVSECGHKIDARPRILKIDPHTGSTAVFFDLPEEQWVKTGAFTGACRNRGRCISPTPIRSRACVRTAALRIS